MKTKRVQKAADEAISRLEPRHMFTAISVYNFNTGTTSSSTSTANYTALFTNSREISSANAVLSSNATPAYTTDFTGTTVNADSGDVAGNALAIQGGVSNANNGAYLQEAVSTVGYGNIIVSFATQGTSTGFTSDQFQVSTGSPASYVNVGAPYVPASSFALVTENLSGVAGVNNNANLAFRIVLNGATNSTGNNRFDNLVVSGTFLNPNQAVSFNSSTYSIPENGTNATITVTRLPANLTDLSGTSETVNYYTTDLTATHTGANPNYTATASSAAGTVTFLGTATSATFTVPVFDIAGQGGNKTFGVTLTNPVLTGGTAGVGASIGSPSSATVTIVDTTATYGFPTAGVTVNENAGNVDVSIARTGYVTDAGTATYTLVDGSAKFGTNYSGSQSGTVTFNPGQSVVPLIIPISNIAGANGPLNFMVNVTGATAAATDYSALSSSQTSTTVTIVDVDALTNTLTGAASAVSEIETTGYYSGATTVFLVGDTLAGGTGSSNAYQFNDYEILDFTKAKAPSVYPIGTTTVTSLSNLSLMLQSIQYTAQIAGSPVFNSQPGNLNIYYSPDTTTTPGQTSPALTFNTLKTDGLDTSQYAATGTPILLGTFSYSNVSSTAFYDTYTPASLNSTVTNSLIANLNAGSPFRFIITPTTQGVGSIATEYNGSSSAAPPIVSFSATTSQQQEHFFLASTTSTALKTDTYANVTVDRTSPQSFGSGDTATVTYTVVNGTGTAGVDYTSGSQTAVFAAGASTATIQIPLINNTSTYGDKNFTVTLGTVTTTTGTAGLVGAPTSDLVTVYDPRTVDVTAGLLTSDTVRGTGSNPTQTYFNVENFNASTGTFASFAVADLKTSSLASGQSVGTFNQIYIGLTNTGTSSTYKAGLIDVYLVENTTVDITSSGPLKFNTASGETEGIDNQLGTKHLLGQINFTPAQSTTGYTFFALTQPLDATATAILASDLFNRSDIRIALTPEDHVVYASFIGNGSPPTLTATPELLFNFTPSPVPDYLTPTSVASYNSVSNTLTVTGQTTFIGDPGANVYGQNPPNVVASGTAAKISFATTTGSQVRLASLTLSGGATAVESNPATAPVVVEIASGLSIDSTSTFDIGYGDLDVAGGSLSAINALVGNGYNLTGGANWKGTGITSSAAAGNTTHLTAVGVVSNASTNFTTLDGDPSVGGSDILVKYTYFGDANLSGTVDGSDYSLIDAGYSADQVTASAATGWYNGDFNYDGTVDGSDYALIDNTFNNQASPLTFNPSALVAAPAAVAVPTPAAVHKLLPVTVVKTATHPATRGAALYSNFQPYFSETPIAPAAYENPKQKLKRGTAGSVVDSIGVLTK